MVKLIDRILESKFSHRLAKWIEDVGEVLYALRARPRTFFITSPTSLGGILDSYELCGRQKCPVSQEKKIEEDYSI